MKLFQASFARGEISPILHARVDLALYQTSLAYLKNFIVLPQGGVTRRPGFVPMGRVDVPSAVCPVRLIPFRYNSEDAMVIELSPTRIRFWTSAGLVTKGGVPYEVRTMWDNHGQQYDMKWFFTTIDDLAGVKFAQSGNVLFLSHRRYPPCMLVRHALDDWEFKPLEFEDGPWFAQSADQADIRVTITEHSFGVFLTPSDLDFFDKDMVGSLFKLEFTVEGTEVAGTSVLAPDWTETEPVEVGGEWYLETHLKWKGRIQLQKSLDGGETWLTLRDYTREDPNEDGQLMLSGAEVERNVLYRVRAQHSSGSMKFEFSVSGYVRAYVFRLVSLGDDGVMVAHRVYAPGERTSIPFPFYGKSTKTWALGSWNDSTGYPGCITFYQDRLVLAGSTKEPQTVWMSKIGDYKSFGVSDPIRDDDAINITLSADDMDGIHSLAAMSDVLVFTHSGEWKISGTGENGALSPNAVVAHQQDSVGSASIQPITVNGNVVMVQTHRTEVHALRYALEQDGYAGSEISIMSQHLFGWKVAEQGEPASRRIEAMAYQQIPDSLLWFVLEDGTAVTCTYQVEHDVVAWARQETAGRFGDVACIPHDRYSELWAAVLRDGSWWIERLASREREDLFTDAGRDYESSLQTLRVNFDSKYGSVFAFKKLIPNISLYTVRSKSAWVAPASNTGRSKRREVKFVYSPAMTESSLTLDAGFERNAAVSLWVKGRLPFTLLAMSPDVAPGG